MLLREEIGSYAISAVAGVLSWIFLNRVNMRGDHMIMGLALSVLAVYFVLVFQWSRSDSLRLTVALLTAYSGSLVISTIAYRLSPMHPLFSFPGPKLWCISSLYLAVVSAKGHRHHVLANMHKRYGKFVRIGPNQLSIISPQAGQVIYTGTHSMNKGPSYTIPGHMKAVAMFFKVPKEDHSERKRIWAQAFTRSGLSQFSDALDRRTVELISCIKRRQEQGAVNITDCLDHWSYDFMGDMVFGGCNELELMKRGDHDRLILGGRLATAAAEIFGQIPWLMDIVWHFPASRHIHELHKLAACMMRRRVASTTEANFKDLASYLISGDPTTGKPISQTDLEIDAAIAILAGSDPVATAMNFIIYFLLSNPKCYEKLKQEIEEAFPDLCIEKEKLAILEYLTAVINEGLRLSTPFFLQREVPKGGSIIDGVMVPGGTVVAVESQSQQLSEENFGPDSMEFHPERWLDRDLKLNKSAFTPFTSGRYVCLGRTLAMQEMRLAVARLVMSFELSFPEDYDQDAFLRGVRVVRATFFDHPLLVKVNSKASL